MLLIYGRKVLLVSSTTHRNKTVHKFRLWMTFFFIPIIPYAHFYLIKSSKGQKEAYVPIFLTAFLLNIFGFFSGIGVCFGALWWLLSLFIYIPLVIINMNNPDVLKTVMLLSIPVAELLCYLKYKKQTELFEEALQ